MSDAKELSLTAVEYRYLSSALSHMSEIPKEIDFDRVAQDVGVKYSKNARQAFRKVWDKLRAHAASNGASSGAAASGSGGDEDEDGAQEKPATPEKPQKKAAAKKPNGAKPTGVQKKGPAKVIKNAPAAKRGRKTKKQLAEEAAAITEEAEEHAESLKTEDDEVAEAEDDDEA